MPATISEIGPCKKLVKVAVPRDRVRVELEKNYHELCNTVALPGFRKGRVPRALLEKRFGKTIEQELQQTLIQETLGEALEEGKLQPIGEPKVEKLEFDTSKDPALQYEAIVAVRPEFAIPDLKGIRVVRDAAPVTDQDVEESLEASRRSRAELRPKPDDATIGPEDFIIADIEYFVGGESIHKHEGEHLWVKNGRVDHGIEVKDLAERLAEVKAGGPPAELPLKLGDDFPVESARGKEATLRLTVKEAKEVKTPPLDDAFAKEAGYETLAELKDEIRQRLLRQREEQADLEVEEKALEAALGRVDFALPSDIVDQELDELALRGQLRAKYQGATEEEAAAQAGKFRDGSRADVERRLKGIFLLDRIARENKIFVTEDEVDQAVQMTAARYGKAVDEVRADMEQQGALQRMRFDMRMDKTRKWLKSKIEVVEKGNK